MKKGFPTKPLQSLCDDVKQDIVDGPFGSELKREDYITEGIPVLKIQNVKPFAIELKKMDYVSAEKFHELRRHSFRRRDIVMTKLGSPLGVSAIVEDVEEGVIVADLVRIRAQQINTKYLCYHLNSQRTNDFINSMQKGTTRPRVTLSVVRELPIYVPPLAEQQRIVALLDEAFAGLATVKANAERNLQNARAIFESHLQSVFSQRGEGWEEKRLEDVCVIGDGNHSSNYPKKEELVRAGIPFIRATNLVAGGISDEDMRYLSPEKHAQLMKGHLKTGDILFTNRGEIGKTAIVDASHDGSNLNSQIAWLRCGEILNNRLLFHVLNSGEIKSYLKSSKNGAALQQFTIRQIKELKIPIPPKDRQGALVARLDSLLEETQLLTRLYERKLAALEELKKSLLHQAFNGEL